MPVINVDPGSFGNRQLAGWDTETSGLSREHQIITSSFCKLREDGTFEERNWLLQPVTRFDPGATEVHGVTEEYAEEHGIPYKQGIREIVDTLNEFQNAGGVVVAYNAAFDATKLYDAAQFADVTPVDWTLLFDPHLADKFLEPYRRKSVAGRKLIDVCEYYKIPLSEEDAHNADFDAKAAALLAAAMYKKFMTVDNLQELEGGHMYRRLLDFYTKVKATEREAERAATSEFDLRLRAVRLFRQDAAKLIDLQAGMAFLQNLDTESYFARKNHERDIQYGYPVYL